MNSSSSLRGYHFPVAIVRNVSRSIICIDDRSGMAGIVILDGRIWPIFMLNCGESRLNTSYLNVEDPILDCDDAFEQSTELFCLGCSENTSEVRPVASIREPAISPEGNRQIRFALMETDHGAVSVGVDRLMVRPIRSRL